ncbi:helix-turn-helix domain-containing protein [Paenibacillus sp. BC26]|uniref:helix-turn-helix domain-containing protein n=1 Tax=Paenibacillus sp. BC26 TaxID=1881032 RepID=UPI0008EC4AAD|nr:helix-turn-helix transcriptional regulator [Paenibacillus sp. BC26]SFS75877.1 Transcriptional regulator, contains XRE-family HTH domain [Paenibacillus sp. BC26]
MRTLGQQVRNMRIENDIGLNEYAKELEVSAGYLSNFETGKTDTVQLKVLEKILVDLGLTSEVMDSTLDQRIRRITSLLVTLHNESPLAFDYFANNIEQGVRLFSSLHNKSMG